MSLPKLTFICPVYNEAIVVPVFVSRLATVRETLAHAYDIDLLFTNNASTDETLDIIYRLRSEYPWIYVASLARNSGVQASLECGLRLAQGDLFILIDVDGEDPPEMCTQFIREHEAHHFDVVYGQRIDRPEPLLLKTGRKLYYRLLRALSDEEIILDMAEFLLMTAEVRDAIMQDRTSSPFIRSSIGRIGFSKKGIPYKRNKRLGGASHFNAWGLCRFAIEGILASTTLPLRLPLYALPLWFSVLVALASQNAVHKSGLLDTCIFLWTAAFFSLTLSFISLYVARTYKNSQGRPNFVIDSKKSVLQPYYDARIERERPSLLASRFLLETRGHQN